MRNVKISAPKRNIFSSQQLAKNKLEGFKYYCYIWQKKRWWEIFILLDVFAEGRFGRQNIHYFPCYFRDLLCDAREIQPCGPLPDKAQEVMCSTYVILQCWFGTQRWIVNIGDSSAETKVCVCVCVCVMICFIPFSTSCSTLEIKIVYVSQTRTSIQGFRR
jgi:hypothetical protein